MISDMIWCFTYIRWFANTTQNSKQIFKTCIWVQFVHALKVSQKRTPHSQWDKKILVFTALIVQ